MNHFRILTLLSLIFLINIPLLGQFESLQPDATRWTSKEGISFQVVCYTDPKKLGDTEPHTGALLRIYFLNTRDHTVYDVITNTDGGLQINAISASGQVLPLHSKPPMSVSRTTLEPNKMKAFTYTLTQKKWDFLKGMPLTISTRIYDPTTKELITVEAPIEIKSGK